MSTLNQRTKKDPTTGRELLMREIETYLEVVESKLNRDALIHVDSSGGTYHSRNNLLGTTYARMSFTNSEQEYFYEVYDKLWREGYKMEAYCLMRLIFGIMSKEVILQLYRKGHLFSYSEILNYAKSGWCHE